MTADQKICIEVMFIIAAALFASGFWILRLEKGPRKWPKAQGVIIKSTTEGGPKETRPVIEYEFTYQGQSYKSAHWRLGNYTMGDRPGAEAVTSRYWVGQPVTVFVNTLHPTESVLETRVSLCWVPFIIGIGFFLLTVAILIMLLSTQRRPVG